MAFSMNTRAESGRRLLFAGNGALDVEDASDVSCTGLPALDYIFAQGSNVQSFSCCCASVSRLSGQPENGN